MAVSGNVAECMAIDGNLKRAVQDTLDKDSYDAVMLRLALLELAPEAWKYYPHGPALAAAAKARSVIQENREEFDRLTVELMENRSRSGSHGPGAGGERQAARGVDYAANLAALRGGQVAGLSELRSLASKAAVDGNAKLAKLMEQTLARREGRSVEPVVRARL